MKKILSLILALLMMLSAASMIFADTAIMDGEAAPVEDKHAFAIEFLSAYGIYKGGDDEQNDIQRYQMALFVARIATGWTDDATWEDGDFNASEFTDITEEPASNYLGAISYANQMKIIEGDGKGHFMPTKGITYQDALAMVVRTLGYKELVYPWGFVEQAIKLGLTKNLEGVKNTDVLTRAQVAQIIYNALFAECKDGETLASKNFGLEEGWRTVLITATEFSTIAGAGKAGKDKVGFKVINKDGTLENKQYVALASDFGFNLSKNEDNKALGAAYKVIFDDNGAGQAKVLFAKSLYTETLWKLDNDSTELSKWLEKMEVVTKYKATTDFYTGGAITTDGQAIIMRKQIAYEVDSDVVAGGKYGIDWETGDIVELQYDSNGNASVKKVEWYYNSNLDTYFKTIVIKDSDGEYEVANKYMTAEDLAQLSEDFAEVIYKKKTVNGFKVTTDLGSSAYSSWDLYDTDENGVADRAVYDTYKIGYYMGETNKACSHGCSEADNKAYTFQPLGVCYIKPSEGGVFDVDFLTKEGACDDCSNENGWLNTDFITPEVGGLYLYSMNKASGEVRVIKEIGDGTDADSYMASGYLRNWSLYNQDVNIGGTTFTLAYPNLQGYLFEYNYNAYLTREYAAKFFAPLFNQYVDYIVVDGKVVYIEKHENITNDFIIVESYAGVDSEEGLMVINGYFASNVGARKQIRLASVNSWEAGDWYATTNKYVLADMIETFNKGAILAVTSTDGDTGAYNVTVACEYDPDYGYVFYDDVAAEIEPKDISINFTGDADLAEYGYYKLNGEEGKVPSDLKIVLLRGYSDAASCVDVYTFKTNNREIADWSVEGKLVCKKDNTYVIAVQSEQDVNGFEAARYQTKLVKLFRKYSAGYDKDQSYNDFYIIGSTKYEAQALDLLTSTLIKVTAQNMKLYVEGLYVTNNNNVIVDEYTGYAEDFYIYMQSLYANDSWGESGNAEYRFETINLAAGRAAAHLGSASDWGTYLATDYYAEAGYPTAILNKLVAANKGTFCSKIADGNIESKVVYKFFEVTDDGRLLITAASDEEVTDLTGRAVGEGISRTAPNSLVDAWIARKVGARPVDGYVLPAYTIYANGKTVIYLDKNAAAAEQRPADPVVPDPIPTPDTALSASDEVVVYDDLQETTMKAEVIGINTWKHVDGNDQQKEIDEYILQKLVFTYADKWEARHAVVATNNFHFGEKGVCDHEDYLAELYAYGNVEFVEAHWESGRYGIPVYVEAYYDYDYELIQEYTNSVVTDVYDNHGDDCVDCNFAKQLTFVFDEEIEIEEGETICLNAYLQYPGEDDASYDLFVIITLVDGELEIEFDARFTEAELVGFDF